MILDKVCYIHLRNLDPNQYNTLQLRGGATIAWVVEAETGNIIIGKPARCMTTADGKSGDVFRRDIGRNLAHRNLLVEPHAFVVTREALVHIATAQARAAANFSVLTPDGKKAFGKAFADIISDDLESVMSSNWYEQVVRSHFVLHQNNFLELASEAINPFNVLLSV